METSLRNFTCLTKDETISVTAFGRAYNVDVLVSLDFQVYDVN